MSSAVIGALRVNLGIDSAQFQQGLANAQGALSRFGQMAKAGLVAAAAASAAAIGGIGLGVKGALDSADDLSKVAQKTGIATDELSALKYAADLSGVSFETLQGSIGRLNRNMAEASLGTGAGAKAFQALGISVTGADGKLKSTSVIIAELSDKFAAMPDGAQKTALAMQLMGRSGAEMIPLLNGGSLSLRQMREEAEAFGIIVDTSTGKAAERFNDALSKLATVASGVMVRLSAEMAPTLAAIAEYFVEAARNSGGFASAIQTAGRIATEAAMLVMDAWYSLRLVFAAAEVAATGFGMVVQKVAADVALYVAGMVDSLIGGLNTVISKANEVLGTSIGIIDPLGSSQWAKDVETNVLRAQQAFATARLKAAFVLKEGMPSEQIRAAADGIKAAGDAAQSAGSQIELLGEKAASGGRKASGGMSEAARAMKEMAAEGARVFEQTRTPLEKYNIELERLNRLLQAGAIDWETYNRAVKQAQDDLDGASDKNSEIADSLSSEFTSAFAAIIDGSKSAKEAFTDLAKSITQMFLNRALQRIFDQIFGGLFGGLGGGLGAAGGVAAGLSAPAMAPQNVGDGGGAAVTVINNTGQPSSARETTDNQGNRRIEVTVGEMVAGEMRRGGSALNQATRGTFALKPALVGR